MTLILKDPSDAELNAAFAEHVAGWNPGQWDAFNLTDYRDKCNWLRGPNSYSFTTSFDAVLPWLDETMWKIERAPPGWCYVTLLGFTTSVSAESDTPAKACVIALLRHKGVRVEVSPQPETERTP